MISSQTEEKLRRLLGERSFYKPRPEVLEQIANKEVWAFVGATCMGKTTIMRELAKRSSDYGEFIVFTTREPRADDNASRYAYYEHTDASLAALIERLETKDVLQYDINPFSLLVYGSDVDGYRHRYNLGDIFASSIDGFRRLGFGTVKVISLVTEPATWLRRFDERFPLGHPGRNARKLEAASSLRWSLGQSSAPDHYWLINNDSVSTVADKLLAMLATAPNSNQEAMQLAQACLEQIEGLEA
jgi:hypothetical protein